MSTEIEYQLENRTLSEGSSSEKEEFIPELELLWDQLNYTDLLRKDEKIRLEALINVEKNNVLHDAFERKKIILKEITTIKAKHLTICEALGKSNEEKVRVNEHGNEGTLLQKLEDVKSYYNEIEPIYVVRVKLFQDMWNRITTLFDKIGYEKSDRGEFAEFSNEDLTSEHEDQFRSKITELEEELNERIKYIEDVHTKIQKMCDELGEKISPTIEQILNAKQVTTTAYETVLEYYENLTSIKDSRAKQVSELALDITHCWDLLKVIESERKAFIEAHSHLSQANIESLEKKLKELHSQVELNLSEMFETVKKDAAELCKALHYTSEQTEELITPLEDEKESFYFLAKKCVELKKNLAASMPIIQFIQQREEIIQEYENINQTKDNIKDLQSDKIIRRYKFTLPRIEKKLLLSLIEYKECHGSPFLWDGSEYENNLNDIKLSISEIKQAKSKGHHKKNRHH